MSEENKVETQTNVEPNNDNKGNTEVEKNVPYDRFQEVVSSKNEMATQLGKLQAQIDKLNADNKSKAEAKLVKDGKLNEAIDILTKERDDYKIIADEHITYTTKKRESLMSKLTTDEDKSIGEGLSDLNKLETYVNKVINVNAPSTSQARATSGKVGEFGGFGSVEEFAQKDPNGFQRHLQDNVKGYIK